MDKSCLGIATSPRRRGNTTLLLKEALAGAEEAGARVELLTLEDYSFSPCRACDGCWKNGECVIMDGMQEIYRRLLAADSIILAAPIFSMGICAQAKALIDRGQRFWATKYVLKRPVIGESGRLPRRGLFISTSGTDLQGVFDCAVRTVRYYFKMLEVEYTKDLLVSKIDRKGEILSRPEALAEAREAGRQLVE